MKRYVPVILCGLLSSVVAPAMKDASSMVRRGEDQLRGRSLQSVMSMRITRPEFTRELRLRSWNLGTDKSLVEILAPVKEAGVTSLRADNQMSNYLPKSDQVIRVPTSLMLQSWMGSDFTNDDLMKVSSLVKDYNHTVSGRETIGKDATVVIDCIPKPNAPVVWGKIRYWARVSDDLPVKQEYYDEKDKLIRTLTLSEFKRMDDRTIPTKLTMQKASDARESTTVVYEKVLYDRVVEDHWFNRDHLRRTSQMGKDLKAEWGTQSLPGSALN